MSLLGQFLCLFECLGKRLEGYAAVESCKLGEVIFEENVDRTRSEGVIFYVFMQEWLRFDR